MLPHLQLSARPAHHHLKHEIKTSIDEQVKDVCFQIRGKCGYFSLVKMGVRCSLILMKIV